MSVFLPITNVGPRFRFACELENVTYSFEFRWNDRDSGWYMTIGDSSGATILAGVKVSVGVLLLGRASSKSLPVGDFLAIDTAGLDQDAAFEDLGRRVQVAYFTAAEMRAAVAGIG